MISIKNLHFSYGKKKVFDGLELQLEPGHIYGLLGKNGTGKSTLLKNIAGLLYPKKGLIEVDGFHPSKRSTAFLQQIFMIPEEFYISDISLEKLVKYHASFYPSFDNTLFEKYINEFEIPAANTIHQMSYGQKKKVLIGFCLACNTKVILMDEPTNGLDIISKSQFRKVIAGAIDESKSIIISTHQVKDLESLIDRVIVIDEGQILFDQTVDAITSKLSFKISFDSDEVRNVLYSESSIRGTAIVTKNEDNDESKLDLELLYKAIVTNRQKIQNIFNA
jgi:ABC-2 type transport system ATP-binding protein